MAMGEHILKVGNRQIQYYDDGIQHSRTILLLHGGIGDAKENWQFILPGLAEDYHVLAPDLPGFGGSESLPANADLSDITAWLIEFLQSQDVEQVVVIGNSFGALLARLMATQYPHKVAAIILINGGFVPAVPSLIRTMWSNRSNGRS